MIRYYIAVIVLIVGFCFRGVTHASDPANIHSQFHLPIKDALTERQPTVRSRCRRFLSFVERAESELKFLKRDIIIEDAIKRGESIEKPKDYQPRSVRYDKLAIYMAGLNNEQAIMHKLITSKYANLSETEIDKFHDICNRSEALNKEFVELKKTHGFPDANVHPGAQTKEDKALMKRMFPEEENK